MSDNPGDNTPAESQGAGSDDIIIEVDTSKASEVDTSEAVEAAVVETPGEAAALGTSDTTEPAGEAASREAHAEARIAALQAEKAKLEEEKQDNWNRFLRATADLENFRKRARREADDARYDARVKVLKEMLPVIDNLERAVEHAGQGGNEAGILEGVQLVLRQFAQALERCDVRPVDALGKPFDPNVHEALSQMETAEHPPGSVAQVLQRGYTLGERLLRPSLVVVAKAPPAAEARPAQVSTEESAEESSNDSGDSSGEPGEAAQDSAGDGQGEA